RPRYAVGRRPGRSDGYGIRTCADRMSSGRQLLSRSRIGRNVQGGVGGRPPSREQIFLGCGAVARLPYEPVEDFRLLRNQVHGIYFAIHTPYRTKFRNLVAVYHNLDATATAVVHVG